MKKLYLMLVCLVAFSAQAVNFKFFMGDKEIAPGSTAYFSDYQAEEYEPGLWDIVMNPRISIESDFFTNTVTVTATCTSGHMIQMCAGGSCRKGETVVKENLTVRKNQKLNLEFEFMDSEYEGAAVPDVVTKFSVVDGNGSPVEFEVVMGPSAASVSIIEVSDRLAPTPAGIEYNLESARDFALYTLTGIRLLDETLEGNGVLPTTGLPKGVYVYTLGAVRGKMILK